LKEVARHFFDRLQAELYYPNGQPFARDVPVAQPAADYAVANLGQVKSLFQFDLTTDTDGDGIPDWWEKAHGLNHKNRNDALALSEAGLVTNLVAYRNNLDPGAELTSLQLASASALSNVTLTLITKKVGLSASNPLNLGSSPLVKNGDFQKDVETGIGYHATSEANHQFRRWYVQLSSHTGWKAIGGDQAGQRAEFLQYEVQQQIKDYTLPSWFKDGNGTSRSGSLNQYCELDSHWERFKNKDLSPSQVIHDNDGENPSNFGFSDRSKKSDHGIWQNVSVNRGNYILIFDYRGRPEADSNIFKVWVEASNSTVELIATTDVDPTATGGISTSSWKRAMASFKVEGGTETGNTISLKFDIGDPDTKADTFGALIDNVILLPTAIKEVSFDGNGAAPNNYHLLTSDAGSIDPSTGDFIPTTTYSAPHWVDGDDDGQATPSTSGDKNYPVAFTRNTAFKVGAKIRVYGVTASSTVKIKAATTGESEVPETTVTPVETPPEGSGIWTVTLPPTLISALPKKQLVDKIKFHNANDSSNFEIDWEINKDSAGWYTAGTTSHTVYVTRANPVDAAESSKWPETLFDVGCRNADGKTSSDDALDAIWSLFSGRNVSRVDATTRKADRDDPDGMVFWKTGVSYPLQDTEFLSKGYGICGNWAAFFQSVLGAQGISSNLVIVNAPEPLDEHPNLPLPQQFPTALQSFKTEILAGTTKTVYLAGTQPAPPWSLTPGDVKLTPRSNNNGVNHGVFFAKATWDFSKSFMKLPTLTTGAPDFAAPLAEQTLSAAQGNTNAHGWFGNHAIAMVSRDGVDTYYDPSYGGTTYSGATKKTDWEDASLKAFGAFFMAETWNGAAWVYSGHYVWYERNNPAGTPECTISP
ncbi:MAG: hypothetical protein WCK17_08175, partial [Verrucomicrobiota bacterium]